MKRYSPWLIGLMLILALASFAERAYLRNHASEAVKTKCAREPLDFLYKNQYSDCLRRNM